MPRHIYEKGQKVTDTRKIKERNRGRQETGDTKRLDDGKPRYDLIPTDALLALAELYRAGAEKYEERGWEKGMRWGRCFASMLRHAYRWWKGEQIDPDTGAHHMIAVAWNAIALFHYDTQALGEDDRPEQTRARGWDAALPPVMREAETMMFGGVELEV